MKTDETIPDVLGAAHRFAHDAMATTFEIWIAHPDAVYAEQAAWAAFEEVDRLEQELSRYVEDSDIARISNLATGESLRIGLAAFECLRLCTRMYAETNGAFDGTIGSVVDCWFKEDGPGDSPSQEDLNLARQRTGMHRIELDEVEHTVRLHTSPIQIDLGGIGKGYAVDRVAALLRDWSIDAALIHGGRSSVLALGAPPGTKGWPVTLTNPCDREETLAYFYLQDRALGGSGLRKGQHIIDPRSGRPVKDRCAAWCGGPAAAIADALSTAFMVMNPDEVERYCSSHSGTLAMVVTKVRRKETQGTRILRYGPWESDGRQKQS